MVPFIKMALVNVRWLVCLNHYHYGITTLEAAPFFFDTMQSPSINRNAPIQMVPQYLHRDHWLRAIAITEKRSSCSSKFHILLAIRDATLRSLSPPNIQNGCIQLHEVRIAYLTSTLTGINLAQIKIKAYFVLQPSFPSSPEIQNGSLPFNQVQSCSFDPMSSDHEQIQRL
jgi:hypothetical protein